ncbi:conjugative transposon protein TraM [Mucilaginibacter rubeus]|uniref:Conjugative transposon protein TraM n=1 Tax=Mucilaginibacter rubeus TaxID=2027860 RepID=A0AAE6JE34_9SPHI|nr:MULTISPECIES: conjugative transposon protein TraM [Mucilaginibacter]QEM03691.1 conjugative transposon protein TraM [Mucilaginibacter rubeus]QEM16302.1 conjugative transposon protein TraM [Mucilaginibacter gossypii]QTE40935.1 conjugative transposon protein TraM [Mucilaginibacter rubeus]QTE47538.1 conjugative transposon protein TraM [Mucilaginibacter rubeus]QTE58930.1 conjugative transposon protein TraM [Mucilaginibacter rubeus]
MKINLRQPKYILPLLALPFLCLFFYVYHSSASKNKKQVKQEAGFNSTVADVSPDIKKRNLENKLDAYRDRYKNADGNSAVSPIPSEAPGNGGMSTATRQKRQLDSIDSVMKQRFIMPTSKTQIPKSTYNSHDQQMADALNLISHQKKSQPPLNSGTPQPGEKDPMELFKKQMAYMDSIKKLSDPNYQKEQQEAKLKAEQKKAEDQTLSVVKFSESTDEFNTIKPQKDQSFITAMIDENITGYAGSRIRLRLLEPIVAGKVTVPKDSYLYALISGFSGQRVVLTVRSILYNGQMLPVKLDIYDQDGLPGLYVPDSQFRDFTKDLGTNSIQGVSIDNGSGSGSQFLMSTASKLFQSTSNAIASAIRKNKAKIKYNSYIYLIDTKNLNQ